MEEPVFLLVEGVMLVNLDVRKQDPLGKDGARGIAGNAAESGLDGFWANFLLY